jgi:hypothetical protein
MIQSPLQFKLLVVVTKRKNKDVYGFPTQVSGAA